MSFRRKGLFIILSVITLLFSLSSSAFALEATAQEKLTSDKGLLSISYRGDTSLYPENSLEGILSAREKGADMVSVGVDKTADGIYVLTENKTLSSVTDAPYESVSLITYNELQNYYLRDNTGALTQYRMISLSQTIDVTDDGCILILDIDWSERDGVYDLIRHYNAFDRIIIRTYESAKTIGKWLSGKEEKVNVIGVYDGGIIFNAISHFDTLKDKGMPLVQFESKNYFNVFFGSFFCKRFNSDSTPIAVASMYSPEKSGQRSDSQEGWNELFEMGYRAVETNNIVSLVSYIDRTEKMEKALYILSEKAKLIDTSPYSQTSGEFLKDSLEYALDVLERGAGAD